MLFPRGAGATSGNTYVGGLIGNNAGAISGATSSGAVNGTGGAGGSVGEGFVNRAGMKKAPGVFTGG